MSKIIKIVQTTEDAQGVVNIEDYEGMCGEKALSQGFVQNIISNLTGKILTIIDASIVDERQNKSIKDLIRNVIVDVRSHVTEVSFDEDEFDEMVTESYEALSETEKEEVSKGISLEEALNN